MIFNPVLMQQAFEEIAKQRMAEEIRQWFALNAPKEIADIYNRYVELEKENDINIPE